MVRSVYLDDNACRNVFVTIRSGDQFLNKKLP